MNNLAQIEATPVALATAERGSIFRAVFRLLGMAGIIFGHLVPIFFGRIFLKKDVWWAVARRQTIARHLVRFLKIRIETTGAPPTGNFLYVCNHRSYVDPVCVAVWAPFVPIAKAEVGRWPIIGWGARITGIFYVRRDSPSSRSDTRQAVREVLREGGAVLVFPEGTTAASGRTLPFRAGTFGIAAEQGIGVAPIAIEYADLAAAWVGEDSFVGHFLRFFSKKEMRVRLHFFEPIFSENAAELLEKTQSAIDKKLVDWHRCL